jgi:hypothetical protein
MLKPEEKMDNNVSPFLHVDSEFHELIPTVQEESSIVCSLGELYPYKVLLARLYPHEECAPLNVHEVQLFWQNSDQ